MSYRMETYVSCVVLCVLICTGYVTSQDRCVIGITADNEFQAFVDGDLYASSTEVNSQRTFAVPENSNVLSIHAFNHQGASGIIVMSDTQFNFYTTSDEDRLWWRCREVTGNGANSDLNPQLIPPEWKTAIDESWDRAVGIGEWPTAFPWAQRMENRDRFIQDDRAEWIWTDDPGRDDTGYDGYKNVFCSVTLPLECGGKNLSVSSSCEAQSTAVTIGNVEYCVKYVAPPDIPGEISGLTWAEAHERALADDAILLEVTHPLLQRAARTQMRNNQAQYAWIGGRARYDNPGGPWRWQPACCGYNDLTIQNNPGNQDPYAFLQQGCYADSGSSPDLTGQSVVNDAMTATMCLTQICAQSRYAGLKNGNTCTCSEAFGAYGALPRSDCNMLCAGGGPNCGGATSNFVYAVNGVHSIDWMGDDQPNNFNDVDYCGALRFVTTQGVLQPGQLTDERCRENYLYVCEIPHSSACPAVSSAFCRTFADGANLRQFVLDGIAATTWYQAQQACRALEDGSDIASLFTQLIADSVNAWLKDIIISDIGQNDVRFWVGASRQSWFWNSGTAVSYTNWAPDQPQTKEDPDELYEWECNYVSRDDNYQWKAGRCDDANSDNRYGYVQFTDNRITTTEETTTDAMTTTEPESTVVTSDQPTTDRTTKPTTYITSTHTHDQTTGLKTEIITDRITTTNLQTTLRPVAANPDKPSATPPAATTTAAAPDADAAQGNTSNNSDGLSTFEIVLIVVLVVIVLVLLILILAFYCYKKNQGANYIGPSKYDARPIAPIPTAGYLGEDESVYAISENGSTADLLANPALFGYAGSAPKSARSGHKININD